MAPQGIDIVTVCLDAEGVEGARPDLAAVGTTADEVNHIAVVDTRHELDEKFGITNVPMGVWIDEDLRIVRSASYAWPGEVEGAGPAQLPDEIPDRMIQMATTAGRIRVNREAFLDGVRDWAAKGSASNALESAEEVKAASVERGPDQAAAAAHFELALHLHHSGDADGAVEHFRAAHSLDPSNWTYKRQAWELASRVDGPLSRFWQGPVPGREDEWPYDGDWLTDIEASGPENYYPR